jgi:HD-GYP domain-containing protein (c-di-GMP phosphodiesterase class II)
VCDVYDALIWSRVYRPPWTHQEAMALLREQAGTGFDPRCVNALAEVLDREAGHEDELGRARANAAPKSLPGPSATARAS